MTDVFGRTWVPLARAEAQAAPTSSSAPRSAGAAGRGTAGPLHRPPLHAGRHHRRHHAAASRTFRGFWARDVPQPQNSRRTWSRSRASATAGWCCCRRPSFPSAPGPTPSSRPRWTCWCGRSSAASSARRSPTTEQAHLRTPPCRSNVQPLPPAPPGYTGAVGQMSLVTRSRARRAAAGRGRDGHGDPLRRGNLQGLPEPRARRSRRGSPSCRPSSREKDRSSARWSAEAAPGAMSSSPSGPAPTRLAAPAIPYFDPARAEVPHGFGAAAPARRPAADGLRRRPQLREPHSVRSALRTDGSGSPAADWTRRWPELLPWLFALPLVAALVLTLARRPAGPARDGPAPAAAAGSKSGSQRSARHRLEHSCARRKRRPAAAGGGPDRGGLARVPGRALGDRPRDPLHPLGRSPGGAGRASRGGPASWSASPTTSTTCAMRRSSRPTRSSAARSSTRSRKLVRRVL